MGEPNDAALPEVLAELNSLILRRIRVGLGLGLATVVGYALVNILWWADAPGWSAVFNGVMVVLIGIGFALTRLQLVERYPSAFALLVFSIGCAARALAGVWHGSVDTTALLLLTIPLMTAGALPWGLLPQAAMALVAGAAIGINALFVEGGFGPPPGHATATILMGLAGSVVLAIEIQRHRVRMLVDNVRRRQAEERLTHLNAELEHRVAQRTSELERTTTRLEAEARERQIATHDLHDSQRQLQDILDHAPALIYLRDTAGRYVIVNRHWEQTLGIPRAQAIDKLAAELFPGERAEALHGADRQVLAERRSVHFEITLMAHGVPTTYMTVTFPILDAAGNVVGVCGISSDITERKTMEAALQCSQAALTALIDNTTEAIWSVDRDLNITVINAVARDRLRQIYGGEFESPSQVPLEPSLVHEFRDYYRRALAGEHVQFEREYVLPEGPRYFLGSVHPIVEGGTITGATVFSADITDRRRAEQLARAHQADLAHVLRVSTMGEMAAGLAHEINQPLGSIANYAQGSVRRLREGSLAATDILPIMEAIAHEALRAGEIIRHLRELMRKEPVKGEPTDLNRLVREAAHLVDGEAQQHRVAVQLDVDPQLPVVPCDSVQIEQVILNLLLNAVDACRTASDGNRRVTVSTRIADAEAIEVAVCDDGPGLPIEDVFAPFYSTKVGGLGMGLSISRSIVEAHGGQLRAASNPDGGSTFRFTLPTAPVVELIGAKWPTPRAAAGTRAG